MKTSDEVLQSLANLSAHDREWILERLSTQARKTLLDGSIDQSIVTTSPPKTVDDGRARLLNASPSQLAAVLAAEPAWVTHCLIADTDSDRSAAFGQALLNETNALLRARVERLIASRQTYPRQVKAHMENAVLDALARSAPITARSSDKTSPLAGLLRKLNARFTRQRLRIHA